MGYDIGLGFDIEMIHIIGLLALLALGIAGFMYFKNRSKHIEFDDNLNEEYPRREEMQEEIQKECEGDKCSIR